MKINRVYTLLKQAFIVLTVTVNSRVWLGMDHMLNRHTGILDRKEAFKMNVKSLRYRPNRTLLNHISDSVYPVILGPRSSTLITDVYIRPCFNVFMQNLIGERI